MKSQLFVRIEYRGETLDECIDVIESAGNPDPLYWVIGGETVFLCDCDVIIIGGSQNIVIERTSI